jgi:uncharacterized membrane protein YfcA
MIPLELALGFGIGLSLGLLGGGGSLLTVPVAIAANPLQRCLGRRDSKQFTMFPAEPVRGYIAGLNWSVHNFIVFSP